MLQSGVNGGGIYVETKPPGGPPSAPLMSNTVIYNSTSYNGGCVYIVYSYISLTASKLQWCSATQPGAGRGGAIVSKCSIQPLWDSTNEQYYSAVRPFAACQHQWYSLSCMEA